MNPLRRALRCALAAIALLATATAVRADPVEVVWLGHSAFRITSAAGKVIVIDPFLKTNPKTPLKYKDLAALGKVDLILVTHAHFDHFADAPELAKQTGAVVIAQYELAKTLVAAGMLDPAKTIVGLNKGGSNAPLGTALKIHMVPAEHSSLVDMTEINPAWSGGGSSTAARPWAT